MSDKADSQLAIADGHVVDIFYTLKNDGGETLDSNVGGETLAYLHGAENIVPGLEGALAGKRPGDEVQVLVEALDGYGEHSPELVQHIGRDELPADADPKPGMQISAQSSDGHPVNGVVAAVAEDKVSIDFNHPLAGVNLHFDVAIAGVRPATAEEAQHGHPHGPGGHDH